MSPIMSALTNRLSFRVFQNETTFHVLTNEIFQEPYFVRITRIQRPSDQKGLVIHFSNLTWTLTYLCPVRIGIFSSLLCLLHAFRKTERRNGGEHRVDSSPYKAMEPVAPHGSSRLHPMGRNSEYGQNNHNQTNNQSVEEFTSGEEQFILDPSEIPQFAVDPFCVDSAGWSSTEHLHNLVMVHFTPLEIRTTAGFHSKTVVHIQQKSYLSFKTWTRWRITQILNAFKKSLMFPGFITKYQRIHMTVNVLLKKDPLQSASLKNLTPASRLMMDIRTSWDRKMFPWAGDKRVLPQSWVV